LQSWERRQKKKKKKLGLEIQVSLGGRGTTREEKMKMLQGSGAKRCELWFGCHLFKLRRVHAKWLYYGSIGGKVEKKKRESGAAYFHFQRTRACDELRKSTGRKRGHRSGGNDFRFTVREEKNRRTKKAGKKIGRRERKTKKKKPKPDIGEAARLAGFSENRSGNR